MLSDIGKKIKVLAIGLGSVLLSVGVLAWIVFISQDNQPFAWSFLVGGIVCYLSSWFLYGFGQLIENSDLSVGDLKLIYNNISKIQQEAPFIKEEEKTSSFQVEPKIAHKAPVASTSIHNAIPARGYKPAENKQNELDAPDSAE